MRRSGAQVALCYALVRLIGTRGNNDMTERLLAAMNREEGHARTIIGPFVGAVGAVMLGIGAAKENGTLDVIGGIVLGVGLIAGSVIQHMVIDWEMFRRTSK